MTSSYTLYADEGSGLDIEGADEGSGLDIEGADEGEILEEEGAEGGSLEEEGEGEGEVGLMSYAVAIQRALLSSISKGFK